MIIPMKPKVLATTLLAKTRLFAIEQLDLEFSNGEQRQFERLARGKRPVSAVMIAPMLDHDTVLMVREYGAGIEDYYLGLPKGIIEVGEQVKAAANREMMEEVGYGAHTMVELKTTSLSPGYMERRMALVLAQDLYEHQLPGDEPEPLEVVPIKLSQLMDVIKREELHESRTIAALFLVREYLHGTY